MASAVRYARKHTRVQMDLIGTAQSVFVITVLCCVQMDLIGTALSVFVITLLCCVHLTIR